jgi:hypothetical protein
MRHTYFDRMPRLLTLLVLTMGLLLLGPKMSHAQSVTGTWTKDQGVARTTMTLREDHKALGQYIPDVAAPKSNPVYWVADWQIEKGEMCFYNPDHSIHTCFVLTIKADTLMLAKAVYVRSSE